LQNSGIKIVQNSQRFDKLGYIIPIILYFSALIATLFEVKLAKEHAKVSRSACKT
jgi:hypothetical protein